MKIAEAKRLLSVNIEQLDLGKLQKHKVKLLDAWRESRADYGMPQAVRDGFYIQTRENAAEFTPKEIWLTQNLSAAIDMACIRENKLLRQSRNKKQKEGEI